MGVTHELGHVREPEDFLWGTGSRSAVIQFHKAESQIICKRPGHRI